MTLLPHHDGSPLYVSTQSPDLGDEVRVRVRVPVSFGEVAAIHARSNPNREPRFAAASVVRSAADSGAGAGGDGWDWWEAVVEVENPVHGYRFHLAMADGRQFWLNASGLHDVETLDSEDFKLVAYPAAPDWAASSVLYQIFPDRFGRSAAADERELPDWAIPAAWWR